MTDIQLRFEADIAAPAERIFAIITDLRRYDEWLRRSGSYPGTVEISDDPVRVGTTYVEAARQGTRHGTVTVLEPPHKVVFHQPMSGRPRLLGTIDITVRYTLSDHGDATTHLTRDLTLLLPPALRPARRFVVAQFRTETERTMQALKARAEIPGG